MIVLISIGFSGRSQSIDFGIEVQNNYNYVESFDSLGPYDPENIAVSVSDLMGDTSNIHLYEFQMENNWELPLYFRFNFRKRWFLDLKLSNSLNTLTMAGVANYNDNYYTSNYGTFDEYVANAQMNGLSADSSDYENYINSAKELNESEIRTIEKFRLLSYTANAGVRLFPHKSVKMIVAAGFTMKFKFRKYLYNYVDLSNNYINDVRSIESGLDWYAERSTYFNFMLGLEFYRFRLAAYLQTGFQYTFPQTYPTSEVTYVSNSTAFDVVRSYGFTLGANLFSMDVGKNVKKDLVSSEDIIISNIKKKQDRFDIGARFERRGFNDMYTYYDDPTLKLHVMQLDSMLYDNSGTLENAYDLEYFSLGDIKRVAWGPRLSGFTNIYLTKRLGVRGSMGGSILTYDIESTQLKATVLDLDTAGIQYVVAPNTPQVRRAVFRKSVFVGDIIGDVTYKVIDRDLFSVSLFGGFGISVMGFLDINRESNDKGYNQLSIHDNFDNWYESGLDQTFDLYEGEMNVDLHESPAEMISTIQNGSSSITIDPEQRRFAYPFFRIGLDANIERYTVGFGFDVSGRDMDKFLLRNYSSAYMSIGYKLWKR